MLTSIVIFKGEKTIIRSLLSHTTSLDLNFLFLKGLRPTVWESTDINIGGKNTTDINFAIIRDQVRFIDTTKYFQQSLAS